MGDLRTLTFICALIVTMKASHADAHNQKQRGAGAVALLPDQGGWTSKHRSAIDRATSFDLAIDDAESGFALHTLSLRGAIANDGQRPSGSHASGYQLGAEAWHAVGADDVLRLSSQLGHASRRTLQPIGLAAKTKAGYANAQLSWTHGHDKTFSTGWFRQGGWGGRRLDLDVMRLANGEPAAATGVNAALAYTLGTNSGSGRSSLRLEAHDGSKAVGVGAGMHHASDVALTLTSTF